MSAKGVAFLSTLLMGIGGFLAFTLYVHSVRAAQVVCHGSALEVAAAVTLAVDVPAGGTAKDKCTCYNPINGNKPFGKTCVATSAYTPDQKSKSQAISAIVAYTSIAQSSGAIQVSCVGDTAVPAGTCKTIMRAANGGERNADITEEQAAKIEGWPGSGAEPVMNGTLDERASGGLDQVFTPHNEPIPGTGGGGGSGSGAGGQGSAGTVGGNTGGASTPTTGASPATQIGNIANPGGQTPSSGSDSGSGSGAGTVGTGKPTFSPSPQISSSPFSLGSLFGGGGGGGNGSPSGGTIAYAPQGDPGFYNRNFQAVDAQITFPKAQPSPQDILAYLAQNSKRQQGNRVTAEELADRGVVNTVILQAINNAVTPVGDFIRSFFTAEDVSKPTGEEVSAVAREEKPPLERGRLVLTLSADDSLVPGDPTLSTVFVPDEEYETFESIPSSNRAWVENAPRAGERIDSLAGAPPTYGWGEPPQIEERGGVSEGDAPQISDVSYDPFLPRFGFEGEAEEGSGTEPPRSFFSVMGRSFGTIIDAVGNLFANIGKALFWWL